MRRAPYVMLLLAACSPGPVKAKLEPMAITSPGSFAPQPRAPVQALLDRGSSGGTASRDPMPVHVPSIVAFMPVAVPDSTVEYMMHVVPGGGSSGIPARLRLRFRAPSAHGDSTLWLRIDSLNKRGRKK